MRRLCFGFLALAVVLVWANCSQAALKLQLDDGTGPSGILTVTDGGLNDANASAGAITVTNPLGNWSVNVVTGLSKPALSDALCPHMDLNSVNVTSQAGGILTIQLTDTDFLGPVEGFTMTLGGTTNGLVDVAWYADASNVEFGTGESLASFGPFGAVPFPQPRHRRCAAQPPRPTR